MIKDADGKTPLMLVRQEIGDICIDKRMWLDASEMDRRLLYLCDLAQGLVKSVPYSLLWPRTKIREEILGRLFDVKNRAPYCREPPFQCGT
eukprot:CAMPEP_0197458164 /NCGR_PEP_ID=MMETSP1175-20131217/47927_1 /TAXON_ID=1003142 /ORGANISM="Triceratium dubium, Strain CCMP147" /LENGTH=90 /DNA_ID=CAMNT_0042992719 /DNA_START=10 /DNA_END=279 /DNA_ORIENTATION=+